VHLPEDDLEVIEVLIRTGVWRVGKLAERPDESGGDQHAA
jgi:hypothetical protein